MRFPHQVVIQRATGGAADDRGIPAQTWATSSTVPAFVQPKSAHEMEQLTQAGPVLSTHNIYLGPATDILASDRLTWSGLTFQVDGVINPAGLSHHLKAEAHVVSGA